MNGHKTDTMPDNVIEMPKKKGGEYDKISRNGERFWVQRIDKGMGDTRRGKVANFLHEHHPYAYGDMIEYLSNEVLETIP